VIQIATADQFFVELRDRVRAVTDLKTPDPQSTRVAIALTKRYVANDADRVRLHDLVRTSIDRIEPDVNEIRATPWESTALVEGVARVRRYDALTEPLAAIYANGCCWGTPAMLPAWRYGIERLATTDLSGTEAGLRRYPALIILYAGGLGAVQGDEYTTLTALLRTRVHSATRGLVPAVFELAGGTHAALRTELANLVMQEKRGIKQRFYSAHSQHLHEVLKPAVGPLTASDESYDELFDRFEILVALVYADVRQELGYDARAPIGRFGYRHENQPTTSVFQQMLNEIEREGDDWKPVRTGVVSKERLESGLAAVREGVRQSTWW
jgi:hypothetical protein